MNSTLPTFENSRKQLPDMMISSSTTKAPVIGLTSKDPLLISLIGKVCMRLTRKETEMQRTSPASSVERKVTTRRTARPRIPKQRRNNPRMMLQNLTW